MTCNYSLCPQINSSPAPALPKTDILKQLERNSLNSSSRSSVASNTSLPSEGADAEAGGLTTERAPGYAGGRLLPPEPKHGRQQYAIDLKVRARDVTVCNVPAYKHFAFEFKTDLISTK